MTSDHQPSSSGARRSEAADGDVGLEGGRVILLGLDGFHEDLLVHTPNLQRMAHETTSGSLESVVPVVTSSAWATIHTGKGVATHGVSGMLRWESDTEYRPYRERDIRHKAWYELLHEAGKRVFLMNVPFTEPPRVPGDVIQSWFTASNDVEDYLQPRDLAKRYPSIADYKLWSKDLESQQAAVASQVAVAKEVFEARDHDVCCFYFSATDFVQHRYMQGIEEGTAEGALEIFRMVDELAGWLDARMGPEDTLLVFSDHGFRLYERKFFINDWLAEKGYLQVGGGDGSRFAKPGTKKQGGRGRLNLGRFAWWVRQHPALHRVLDPVKRVVERATDSKVVGWVKVDLEASRAFCKESSEEGIYVNRRVADTREKVASTQLQLVEDLNAIDGLTARTVEEVHGAHGNRNLPDVFLTSNKYKVERGVAGQIYGDRPVGGHALDGYLIMRTPHATRAPDRGAGIVDLCPTILTLAGVPVPDDVEGESLVAGAEYTEAEGPGARGAEADEDMKIVEERLKSLGYL